ncbi:MAG: LytTR family DNA-binding domain-containing protein [Vicingaceae bacterium]
MKAIIVDDERLARQELKNLLKEHPEIDVVEECNNADNAKNKIESLKPDLVFLDIQMPGKNGFELLEELTFVPRVVFTTAYDEYALKAFEVSAFDYLLKPIESGRLSETIDKLLKEAEEDEEREKGIETSASNAELGIEDQVFVKDGSRCWFVKLKNVSAFESEGNYVRVFFDQNKPLILKSLNSLEKRLDSKHFFRANRKFIINLEWVTKIEEWFNGGFRVTLEDGKQIEISRRQASKLKDMMSL